ncbi:YdcH family protein [Ottowia thiooxydans]|uniref:YdcH family protein n=1 Tax=Ottowia thiooxydans TaxID=219182 RepID=UPI0003F9E65E|nr:YdcH family protein [Ottowia thiooxydans]
MFPEYRDLIHKLKMEDAHFARLFEKHHVLDHQVKRMTEGQEHASSEQIEVLKKEKLLIKDELYVILKKADPQAV